MSDAPFPRFDGLMDLAKREGVDVRPTLLRVLTDLYVQAQNHTLNEDRQFAELFSRLIAFADDATVAAVRARLAIYPGTPEAVMRHLDTLPSRATATPRRMASSFSAQAFSAQALGVQALGVQAPGVQAPAAAPVQQTVTAAPAVVQETVQETAQQTDEEAAEETALATGAPLAPIDAETALEAGIAETTRTLSPQERRSQDARLVTDRFFEGDARLREKILDNLEHSAFTPVAPPDARRAARACDSLERAAFAHNQSAFTMELASCLLLPVATAQRIVRDGGGEALVCAMKALDMPLEVFQRVLMFLDPAIGQSVHEVYRRSHLFMGLSDRVAFTMLSIWRMAAIPAGKERLGIGKYRASLYDDERQRARQSTGSGVVAPAQRPGVQQPAATTQRTTR